MSRIDRDKRFSLVKELCEQLMVSIENVIPLLPISLVASVFVQAPKGGVSEFEVKARVHRLMEELEAQGAPVHVPTRGAELSVTQAFNMLKLRRMIIERDGLFSAPPESIDILAYYANAMDHWRHGEAGNEKESDLKK
ncbi:MAG: hypothetical protein JRI47_05925 [Deltaproteobacteria bacterium]|nr:hypothetical protein [Deltaproteobacteria bacterium]